MAEYVVVVGTDARPVELAHRRRIMSTHVGGVHPMGSEVGLSLPQGQSSSGPQYYTESGLTKQPTEVTLAAVFRCTSFAGFNVICGHQYGTDYGYSVWAQDANILFGRVPTAFTTPSCSITTTAIQDTSHWYAVVVSSSAAYGSNMTIRDLNNGAYLSGTGSHQALASATNRSGAIGYWGTVEDDGFNGYIKMGAMWRRAWTPGQRNAWINDPLAFVRQQRRRTKYRHHSGSTVYTMTLGGVLTPSGTAARAASKQMAGALTPSGVVVRKAAKLMAGSITPSGIVTKKDVKAALTGSVTPAGAVATIKAIARTFTGALTPSGAITRAVGFVVTGGMTPSGTVAKKDVKAALSGSLTPAGAIGRGVSRMLSGALTPSGVVALARSLARTLTGGVTPSGALTRAVSRALSAGLTPSGVLFSGNTFFRTLTGTLTPSGVEAAGAYANYYAYDTTARADSSSSLGTADKGGSWTAQAGSDPWGLIGGLGYSTQTAAHTSDIATLSLGGVPGEVGLTFNTNAIQYHVITVVPRYVDYNNFLQINAYAGALKIVTKVASVATVRVTVAQGATGNSLPATGAASGTIGVQITDGGLVIVSLNGTPVPGLQYQLTGTEMTALGSTTMAGVLNSWSSNAAGSTTSTFTNFYAKRASLLRGVLTFVGTLTKQLFRAVGGAVTPAGGLGAVRSHAPLTLTGSLTPAGTVAKRTARTFTGLLTTTTMKGVVVRKLARIVAGSLTPTGALLRKVGKALRGSLTPSGTISRVLARLLGGSLTPSGTVTGGNLFTRTLTGVLTPAGALVRRTGKALGGVLTPAGTLVRRVIRLLTGSLTPSGTASKGIPKLESGSLTPTGTTTRTKAQFTFGSLVPSGSVSRGTAKALTAAQAFAGAVATKLTSVASGILAMFRGIR